MLALIALLLAQQAATGGPRAIVIQHVNLEAREVLISATDCSVTAPATRLLLAATGGPFAWAALTETRDGQAVFKLFCPDGITPQAPWRAWLVGPDLVADLIPHWPDHAALQADIDSLGPGGQSAWVRAGTNQGVAVGDSWWLRIAGQPAARLDAVFVAAEVSFCTAIPLASTPALRPGARVALWPAPAERRAGRGSSAVAYLEERDNGTLVWVAAPPNVKCPPEPRLDFYREGRFLGQGLVERHDGLFWYARFTPAGADALRIGDEAVIRTQTDIDERRFVARIFELTSTGALLNAGEADGLAVGDTLVLIRDGGAAGKVTVRDVQRGYAVVGPPEGDDEAALALHVGDELRFRAPAASPRTVGVVERVIGDMLFIARVTSPAVPVGTPLAVRAAGRTVGVAVLVTAEGSRGGGFALPCSLTQPLAAGMELVCETAPTTAPRSQSEPGQ